jgi:hypothetical protein
MRVAMTKAGTQRIAVLMIGCLLAVPLPALAQDEVAETGGAVTESGTSEVTGSQGGVSIGAGTIALTVAALAALGLVFAIAADSTSATSTTTTSTTTATSSSR